MFPVMKLAEIVLDFRIRDTVLVTINVKKRFSLDTSDLPLSPFYKQDSVFLYSKKVNLTFQLRNEKEFFSMKTIFRATRLLFVGDLCTFARKAGQN